MENCTLRQLVVCRRYIDDLLLISKVWCFDCLCELPKTVYRVPFEPGPRGRTLVWLDMEINLDSITLGMKKSPIRVPPPWDVSQARLRSFFWCKLSRYKQLELLDTAWQEDMSLHLVSLASQGFGRHRLRNLVFSMYKLAPALACLLIPSRPSVETIYKPAEAIYKHAETICKHAQATCKHADTIFPRESYLIPWNRLSNTQAMFATLRKQGSNQQGRHVSAMKSEIMRKTLKRSRSAALALILFPVASRLLKIILVWHLLCLPSR